MPDGVILPPSDTVDMTPAARTAMTDGLKDHANRQRLVTDLRDLIEVVDRRLHDLRQLGNADAVRHMEEIRNRAFLSLESLETENTQSPGTGY